MRSSATLSALFLVCAFSLYPCSTTAQPIVDKNGELVENGGSYYIIPHGSFYGDGLGAAEMGNETCPLSVVLKPLDASKGLAVTLSSRFRSAVLISGIVDISFTAVPTCAETPSKWTVVSDLTPVPLVKLTGYQNTNGVFIIEKAYTSSDNTYSLSFCLINSNQCQPVGLERDFISFSNNMLFVVSRSVTPFTFVLDKASSATA